MKKLSLAEIAKSLKEEQDFSWIHDYNHVEDIINDVAEGKIKYLGDAKGLGKKWFDIAKQENIPTATLGGGMLAIYAPGAGVFQWVLSDKGISIEDLDMEIEALPFSANTLKDYLEAATMTADRLREVEVAPEPTIKPSTPGTKPRRPNPLRPPKEAPKPRPRASEEDILDDIVAKFTELNEKKGKYSLAEMTKELTEVKRKDLVDKYVGTAREKKLLTQTEFDVIEDITKGSVPMTQWFLKRLEDGSLEMDPDQFDEDAENWKKYLSIFDRKKAQFPIKNIQQIKTKEDVDTFVDTAFSIMQKQEEDPTQRAGTKEQKYKDLVVGTEGPYTIYKIPQHDAESEKVKNKDGENILYKVSCDLGSGTSWCTATGNTSEWFERYSGAGPLYIAIGPEGKKYQANIRNGEYHEFKNQQNRNPDLSDPNDGAQYLYKFLQDKEGVPMPLKAQMAYNPEEIKWDELGYTIEDLKLIKDTNNIENIVWDKVNQSEKDILRWIIDNSQKNVNLDKIDINKTGILSMLSKNEKLKERIDLSKLFINQYSVLLHALDNFREGIDWSTQVDYDDPVILDLLADTAPKLIDKSKLDMSNPDVKKIVDFYKI